MKWRPTMLNKVKEIIKNRICTQFKHKKGIPKEHTFEKFFIKHKLMHIYEYISNFKYIDVPEEILSFSQKCHNILYDIYNIPKCDCGDKLLFINFSNGYCKKCYNSKYTNKFHSKELNMKHDVVSNVSYDNDKLKEFINKTVKCNGIYPPMKIVHYWFITKNYTDILNQIYSRTKYLDNDSTLLERMYHIENDLFEKVHCVHCNIVIPFIRQYNSYKKTCTSKNCISKESSVRSSGRICSDQTRARMCASSNRRKHPPEEIALIVAKNKALRTPEWLRKNSEKLRKNGVFARQSEKMKQKILNGEFTPCITNSWANSRVKLLHVEGFEKYFRSTWDATFQILNPTCLYEKIRIPYMFNRKEHIYMVDFVDEEHKILYEIKPTRLKDLDKNKAKEQYAIEWSLKNGYQYNIISNDWFQENAKKIDYTLYDEKIKKGMKQFLN